MVRMLAFFLFALQNFIYILGLWLCVLLNACDSGRRCLTYTLWKNVVGDSSGGADNAAFICVCVCVFRVVHKEKNLVQKTFVPFVSENMHIKVIFEGK